jgi:SAM-dependent methyltransferase
MRNDEAVHGNEATFHDLWALSTPLDQIAVHAAFEAPAALENQAILRLLGDLKGKRVLDIGAGLGESSVYFALQGAHVTAVDISPGMIERTLALGEAYGVRIEGVVQSGEDLSAPEGAYDIVYVANTLHHVADKSQLFRQIRRSLKPGGRFFSIDPLAYNPVINIYRRMATRVRTAGEAPLTFDDVELARRYFANVQHREFWILGLALFLKYYLVDHIHPNADRYWKRILRETKKSLWWWLPLSAADRLLTRLPGLRRLAWNIVIWGEKPAVEEPDGTERLRPRRTFD